MTDERGQKFNFYYVFHTDEKGPSHHPEELERLQTYVDERGIHHVREDYPSFSTISFGIRDDELASVTQLTFQATSFWTDEDV